jgi:hypothetical protein
LLTWERLLYCFLHDKSDSPSRFQSYGMRFRLLFETATSNPSADGFASRKSHGAEARGILVNSRQHLPQLLDILLQYPQEELLANLAEDGRHLLADPSPIRRWPNDEKPLVPRIDSSPDKTGRFEALHESRYLSLVPPDRDRQLHRDNFPGLNATQENAGFLQGHAMPREKSVQRCLNSNAGLKQPGQQEILAPCTRRQLLRGSPTRQRKQNAGNSVLLPYSMAGTHGSSFIRSGWSGRTQSTKSRSSSPTIAFARGTITCER